VTCENIELYNDVSDLRNSVAFVIVSVLMITIDFASRTVAPLSETDVQKKKKIVAEHELRE
jgi:hypothetical protein